MLGTDREDLSPKSTSNQSNTSSKGADSGILVHALQDLFKHINKEEENKTYFLRCSYVEIYNEQVFDLLREGDAIGEYLSLNEDKNKEFYIKGAIEQRVESVAEVMEWLK
jgi:hypothetical protein